LKLPLECDQEIIFPLTFDIFHLVIAIGMLVRATRGDLLWGTAVQVASALKPSATVAVEDACASLRSDQVKNGKCQMKNGK
jgi:hypothetical protein